MLGLLGGPLNRAAFGRDVKDTNADQARETNTGHFVIALDVARFLPLAAFTAEIDRHVHDLASSKRLPGVDEIRIPGTGPAGAPRRPGAEWRAVVGNAAEATRRRRQVARDRAADGTRLTMTEAETKPSPQGSPFWRFSLQFYRQPGVAEACIALQEESGVDVNLLMFLLWHAVQRRKFSPSEVDWIESKICAWRESAVIPLRTVRRALKAPPLLVPAVTAEAFRTSVKAVELEAERLQQEAMYALEPHVPPGEEAPSSADAARANIAAYETMLEVQFPKSAVDSVLTAFAALKPKGN